MKATYTQTVSQTRSLNHTMMQSAKVMRMNGVELRQHLTEAMERNPFIEVENNHRGLVASMGGWGELQISDDNRKSLFRHLADQFSLVFRSDHHLQIAYKFLQEIEPIGWMTVPVEHIAEVNGFDLAECHHVLEQLQTLEPAGVFCRDLKDCMRLQAIDRNLLDEVMDLLIQNLDQLMDFDVKTLAHRLKVDSKELAQRLDQIRKMDPKPGCAFSFDDTVCRECDVVLNVRGNEITIELNRSSFPSVRLPLISQINDHKVSSNNGALSSLLVEAKALQTAVEMRQSTTLSVVKAIFTRQGDFLTHGYQALIPMRMSEIANDVGVSESTVSRILAGLTIQCQRGSIVAKSLFCNPVAHFGQPRTKHVALQLIKNLIVDEDKKSPLSDHELACLVQNSGVRVSRRTVTKYRQSLGLDAPRIRRKTAELSELASQVGASGISATHFNGSKSTT